MFPYMKSSDALDNSTDRQSSPIDSKLLFVPSPTQREELLAEIKRLRAVQLESFARARFGGWTPQEEAEHENIAQRLALLVRELAELDKPCAVRGTH